jgi:monofunctional glycosyltransferase
MPDETIDQLEEPVVVESPRTPWWRTRWMLLALCAMLLLAGVEIGTLPFGEVTALRNHNPGMTAFMRAGAEHASQEGKKFRKLQEWVPLKSISKDLINAVVVAEDGRFWSHSGFDWFEFKESVERNLKEGKAARGASTITQQLVKNLYLSSSKSPLRKLKEWILTWWMERQLSKSRIIELYLNVIEWGPDIYGVEAASRAYFQKDAVDLSREEAARMAAVIPNPKNHQPDEQSEYVDRRTTMILDRMLARGF